MVGWGAFLVLVAPRLRRPVDPADLQRRGQFVRWLATRRWERPAGWWIMFFGALILVLRLQA